jgi:hypothetical protein
VRTRTVVAGLIVAAVGVVGFLAKSGRLQREWSALTGTAPVLEFPQVLDLGERALGEIVICRLALRNRGGRVLVVDDVRTNCSCSGLEEEVNGQFVRVEKLNLAPGEEARLVMRVSVHGPPGESKSNVVTFHTNDPSRPEAWIGAVVSRVTGGLTVSPASVLIGTVSVGATAGQMLEVRDHAAPPRKITRVTSSNAARAKVSLLPLGSEALKAPDGRVGTLIGRLQVLIDTKKPGQIADEINLFLGEEPLPVRIAVTGRVAPLVEALPTTVVLPRASNNGPLYFAECLCRSSEGKPLDLKPAEVPSGFEVHVAALQDNPSVRRVRVECGKQALGRNSRGRHLVVLTGWAGSTPVRVEIPVQCRTQGGGS